MELVDGEELGARMKRGPIPVAEAMAIAKQIAEALEAAGGSTMPVRSQETPTSSTLTRANGARLPSCGTPQDMAEDGKCIGFPWLLALTWTLTVLPTLGPAPMWDVAKSINDRGDIVGYCYDSSWAQQATRWNARAPLATAQALGFPGDLSVARGVNNSSVVVGGYVTGGNPEQAVAMKPH
jgi:hypothetical protein